MGDAPRTRRELMAGYEHPYRRWIPVAWEYEHVPRTVLVAGLAGAAAVAADRIDGPDSAVLALAAVGGILALIWTLWVTLNAVFIIRGRIRDWDESEHELAAVRRRRPHAGEADRELAHAEYAVSVNDTGKLVTWRFRPLAADEAAPGHALLLTGRPRHDAVAIDDRPFDPADAARAAEQLAEAQQQAAALEQRAVEAAHQGLQAAQTAAELEAEARSTAAALRGITGQAP